MIGDLLLELTAVLTAVGVCLSVALWTGVVQPTLPGGSGPGTRERPASEWSRRPHLDVQSSRAAEETSSPWT
jgi:hypothetical protein